MLDLLDNLDCRDLLENLAWLDHQENKEILGSLVSRGT